jgi:hypothetical protein
MKRFVVTTALVVSAVLVIAQPASASWLDQTTLPPGGPGTDWEFTAVSCTATTTCVAVGNVGGNALLSETRSGNTWTIVSIPGNGLLSGISCTSASSCEAVGQGSGGATLAEVWNGSNWTIQTTQNPAGAASSQLNDVSCKSASACEAVGAFDSGGTTQTLAEKWNGSNWVIQSTPNASSAAESALRGVSCTSASACEAVGQGATGPSSVSLAEVWNGTNWTIQTTPNGSTSVNQLEGVSCTAANACTATGNGLAERWNGSNWTLQTLASPHGDTPAELSRVSCTDKTRCMAVGTFFDKEAVEMLVTEQWNGTSWKVFAAPVRTANDSNGLADVSCTFATACTAVGFYHDPNGPNHALAEDWSLRWQLQAPLIPFDNPLASSLDAVSCPFVNFCAAVGGEEPTGGVFDALVEIFKGNSWHVQRVLLVADHLHGRRVLRHLDRSGGPAGRAVLLITHDNAQAGQCCPACAVVLNGHPEVKYGQTGPPKVLLGTLRKPAGTVTFALAILPGVAGRAVISCRTVPSVQPRSSAVSTSARHVQPGRPRMAKATLPIYCFSFDM